MLVLLITKSVIRKSRISRIFYLSLLNNTNPMKGVIKKTMDKGFGFIAPEDGGKDIFFHSNSLVNVQFNELREGDAVAFDIEDSPKGKNAINVQRA